MSRIGHFFHNKLVDLHVDTLFVLIQNDLYIVLILRMVPAESRQHSLADLIVHIGSGDALFLLDVFYGSKEFCIHNSMFSVSDLLFFYIIMLVCIADEG